MLQPAFGKLILATGIAILASSFTAIAQQESQPSDTFRVGGKKYRFIEQMPQFKGDVNQFLNKAIIYPPAARKKGISGKAIIEFIIDTKGRVTNIKVAKSSGNEDLDAEACRVIGTMPAWLPGRQNGKKIDVYYTLPISFVLE